MFKNISYVSRTDDIYIFNLQDDDFSRTQTANTLPILDSLMPPDIPTTIPVFLATFLFYKNKNLNVVKNMIEFYCFIKRLLHEKKHQHGLWRIDGKHLDSEREWIDKHFPELEYGKKYYPCIYNQFKLKQFTGRI